MSLSQQIALGILTSVLGAALWEFLNHVYPEIKKSLGKVTAACCRVTSNMLSSFKKASSLIGAKLNIAFFMKVLKEAALVVAVVAVYGVMIIGVIYEIGKFSDKVSARPSGDAAAINSTYSSTCECPPLTGSTYIYPSQSQVQTSSISSRYSSQPNDAIYDDPISSNSVISEETLVDCSSARAGRRSKKVRRSGTIGSALSSPVTFNDGPPDLSQ